MSKSETKKGIVYLVGAGPGDSGLITVKGLNCIRAAEVLVYDRLVSPRLVRQAPQGAELIYVGKLPDRHTLQQEEINELLVEKAAQGLDVTRLKGGDPFVFGRGGEEAALLSKHGIPFEIIPGVTSAVAVPAYAGIPVTHRGLSSGFTVVTGHEEPAKDKSDLDWPALAGNPGTNVILMGVGNLPLITERLLSEGMNPATPVALIHRGTEAGQRTLIGVVADIAAKAKAAGFKHPAVIVTGEVVSMRETLKWFERKPLFGRRIVVSRAREQASAFADKLEALGAETLEIPVIKIVPPLDFGPLDRALDSLESYRWVIFTSENGVKSFFSRLVETGKDIRDLKGAAICAIGPKTRDELQLKGLRVDYLPSEYRAEAIVEQLQGVVKAGDKVLLPRADLARSLLPEALAAMGAAVENVTCYRTVPGEGDAPLLKQLLAAKEIDMVTFTSSSTVTNLLAMLGSSLEEQARLLDGVAVASIGPITADTAREHGLEVAVEAAEYTIDGLVEAITGYYTDGGGRRVATDTL
jgi:uroporphyrinogen III methyltransferase / synthase